MGVCPEEFMSLAISAFLMGVACGLRAMIGLAGVGWAAWLGYLPLEGTWLSFLGSRLTPYIGSLLALAELVNDKLPKTPSRLIPQQFGTRLFVGAFVGMALGLSCGHILEGAVAGLVGAVAGTLSGAKGRRLATQLLGRDFVAALLEDLTAFALVVAAVVAFQRTL